MCATDDIGNRTGRGVSPVGISSPPPFAAATERRFAGATGLGLVGLGALSMLAALGWAPGVDLASGAGRTLGAIAGATMIAGGGRLWWRRGQVRARRLAGLTAYVLFLLLLAEGVLQLASGLHPRWGFILSELPAATAESVFDVPGYRTILKAGTRLDALRPADPRIQEGYGLTLEAILHMHAMAAVAAALQDAGPAR